MTSPKTLSIKELLNENTNYIIPIYQRNYSWRDIQIEQLLQDVWDKYKDNPKSYYYIGTLIVDEHNNSFEIIDGQQRYTTIILINAILHKVFTNSNTIDKSNLKFDARPEVENFINQVYNTGYDEFKNPQELECQNINSALKIIKTYLSKRKDADFENYINYFYNSVKIIHVDVPEGTDITHYFEIMNTRGEQLESHEILKAWLIKNCQEENRNSFAKIWEACSQMDLRIQTCFKEGKNNLFGNDLSNILENAIELIEEQQKKESNDSLGFILSNYTLPDKYGQSASNRTYEKYRSVIDFPNFLLVVLQIFLPDNDISLDDKNLLKENGFGYNENRLKVNPEKFVSFLLKCRILFDNYIIKQEDRDGKTDWHIFKPKYDEIMNIRWINTFGKEDVEDTDEQNFGLKDMIMIQTMLQVSYPRNSYKEWLLKALSWLNTQEIIEYDKFMEQLSDISKELYQKESDKKPFTYFNTERFVFNLLDYLLWKDYKKEQLKNLKPEYRKYFDSFRFRGGNSVEHLLPQNHKSEIEGEDKDTILNSFGNLCLISNGNNSKYSDLGFIAKKEQFEKQDSTESLKQTIMFSNEKWNTQEIQNHENYMIVLLDNFYEKNKNMQ
jgi:hypothetical protein